MVAQAGLDGRMTVYVDTVKKNGVPPELLQELINVRA